VTKRLLYIDDQQGLAHGASSGAVGEWDTSW
jgi:hypothetical protein